MTTPMALCLLALMIGVVVVSVWLLESESAHELEEPWLPRELRGARLAYAEATFRDDRHGIVARVDRAYRTTLAIHLVELKTRAQAKAFPSDVIELSAQRVAMSARIGRPVSQWAWVVVRQTHTGAHKAIAVKLLDTEAVLEVRQRYLAIQAGTVSGLRSASTSTMCRNCGQRPRCHRALV